MNYSKTAIQKAVQAFQILHSVTVTPWHCENLLALLAQAHEAEEAHHAATAPVVVPPPPGYSPDAVAFPKAEYDACCGNPATCEQPCFHRPAAPAGDGWGPWIDWGGGDCPLGKGVYAEVILRNGSIYKGRALVDDCLEAQQWRTGFPHDPTPSHSDIVRYRVKA